MAGDRTINLDGQDFPIVPLTLGAMRQAGPAFTRIGIDSAEGMGAQTTIICLAMHAANSAITAALLMSIEMRKIEPREAPPAPPATPMTPAAQPAA